MSKKIFFIGWCLCVLMSCSNNEQPKPKGYVRITLPEHAYRLCDTTSFMTFRCATSARVVIDPLHQHINDFINIEYPSYKATIHLSYKPITNNFDTLTEDARTMAIKHIQKADAIRQTIIEDDEKQLYGIIYDIAGSSVASPCQFFITDTTQHFLRGALYFNVVPNNDSLAPVIDFIRTDIDSLIHQIRWK